MAGIAADDVDLIIVATSTPDNTFPATAAAVQAGLGITGGAAFDIQAVCSGFVYALTTADAFLRAGTASTALVDRVGDLLAHSRLVGPLDLRAVRRRRRGGGAAGRDDRGEGARRARHSCRRHPLRWALQGQALCRWRAIHHQDGRCAADGRQGRVPPCRHQHLGRDARDAGPRRHHRRRASTGSCRIRPISGSSTVRRGSSASPSIGW